MTADLEKAVHKHNVTEKAVSEIIQYGQDRKAWLIFCVSVAHAEEVKQLLRNEGIEAECITGNTHKDVRERILADYKAGKIKALTSQGVLTTGFDAPLTDLIALLRPTKSPGLYVQILGRGLRISPDTGKTDCLVLDYGGNVERHGPIDAINVESIKKGKRKGEAPSKECPECFEIILAGLKKCPDCGYLFPEKEKHESEASKAALLKKQITPDWLDVDEIIYSIHEKEGKPPSLAVIYRCGFDTVREWVCFEHGGYARRKAEAWYATRFFKQPFPIPEKTEDVYQRLILQNDQMEPCKVQVIKDGRWQRITQCDFSVKEGTPSQWNNDTSQRPKPEPAMPAGVDVFDTGLEF